MKQHAALSFFILIILSLICRADSAVLPLHLGDTFPDLTGETLSGGSLRLPSAATGKIAVVSFSFSKAAGKDSRIWRGRLSKDFGANGAVTDFAVIMLEEAPKFLRGMIVSGIKSGMPSSLRDTAMVLYRDEALWKQRLAVSSEGRAYQILLDPRGRILWMSSGSFTDEEYAHLKEELIRSMQPLPSQH